jgi:hypothetical protein
MTATRGETRRSAPWTVTDTVARAGKIGVGYTSDGKILAAGARSIHRTNPKRGPAGPAGSITYAALLAR